MSYGADYPFDYLHNEIVATMYALDVARNVADTRKVDEENVMNVSICVLLL